MNKLLSSLIVAAVATLSVGAQAASHAGGAPMKADAPAMAASGAKHDMKKGDMKKGEMMKDDMKKGDMKKGEMMKDDMKKGDMKKDEMKKDEMKK